MAETQNHVHRVERVLEMRVLEMHDAEPKTVSCPAIDDIIKEAKEVVGDVNLGDEAVLDAALIAAAQVVEHYEITRYGSLVSWARALGRDDCANILQQNLAEERAADEKLTEIAEIRSQCSGFSGLTAREALARAYVQGCECNHMLELNYHRREIPRWPLPAWQKFGGREWTISK